MLRALAEEAAREIRLAERYLAKTVSAGETVEFAKALGAPATLLSVLAEQDSSIRFNRTGSTVSMKRDEAIVMINVMEIHTLEVVSGQVKIFATVIPKWMPTLFWTRSVTVLGVSDAVLSALQTFYSTTALPLQLDIDNDLFVARRAKEGTPIDYTTTDTLSDAADLDISMFDEVTIFIKNTGANSADYAVYTKANAAVQIEYEEVPLTTLAPGNVHKVVLNGRYAKVIIRAKSTTAGASTTIRIEWIGGK